ncbi:sulfatase-like hydrolase/transferase [Candidatus Sumerlaeota bacterium]|nr:sulfatase-like hydrolase/transferase [Candidatus Sumerlaeota bacterium]
MSRSLMQSPDEARSRRRPRLRVSLLMALAVLLLAGIGCEGRKAVPSADKTSGRLIQSFDVSMVKASPLLPGQESEPLNVNLRKAWREGHVTSAGTTETLRLVGDRVVFASRGRKEEGLDIAFWSRTARRLSEYGVLDIEIQARDGAKPERLVWKHRANAPKSDSAAFDEAFSASKPDGTTTLYSFPMHKDWRWNGAIRLISILPPKDAPSTFTLLSMRFRHVTLAERAFELDPIPEFPDREPSPFLRAADRDGELRNCLVAPPGTEIAWTLRVPSNASLSFGTAVVPEPGHRRPGSGGILFTVRADTGSGDGGEEVFRMTEDTDGETWSDHRVSLGAYAGKDVTLVFATSMPELEEDTTPTARSESQAWGCWSAPGVGSGDETHRNLSMISLDCLRTDRVGLFGYSRDTSPVIDGLARKGLAFDYLYAHAAITCTSHHCILSSLYPIAHGITRTPAQLPAEVVTLAQLMRSKGYMTIALTGGSFIGRAYGYQKGFDVFADSHSGSMEAIVRRLDVLLDKYRDEKLFVFLHTFDMHEPYVSDPKYMNFFDPDYKGDIAPGTLLAYDQMLRAHVGIRMACFTSDRILSCDNFMKNSGFESDDALPASCSDIVRSTDSPRRGKYCAYVPPIDDPKEIKRRQTGGETSVDFEVEPEKVYVYGGYMRSRGLRSSARFVVMPLDVEDPDASRTQFITGTMDWQRYVGVVKIPKGCRKVRFFFPQLIRYDRGEVWTDDVFFVPFGSIPAEFRGTKTMEVITAEDTKRINDIYDGSFRYVDTRVGDVVELFDKYGFLQNGAFAVTADHGQDLMDHKWLGHGEAFSWDSVLRVPFIVYAPSIVKTPRRISKLCESVDIAPTLLNLIGIEPLECFQGTNILSPEHRKDYIFASYEDIYAIVSPEHRFRYHTESDRTELNVHATDPGQHVNVAQDNPELVKEYRALLDELIEKYRVEYKPQPTKGKMSPELRDELKNLGYL